MGSMLGAILILMAGMILLYLGAELLVRSSVKLALFFKLSRLVIGLTIVAFATSLPETFASVVAQLEQASGDVALGNVLGSNIANVGLVLGVYLILRPCNVTPDLKWQKMPLLLLVYLIVFLCMLGGTINRLEGVFLFTCLCIYVFLQYYLPPKRSELKEEIEVHTEEKKRPRSIPFHIFAILLSIALLLVGSHFLIQGALTLAEIFQVSQRVIAVSVVALGTSLPEVATALVAALRKEQEILVGTTIGSNIFNSLLIIPAASWVKPIVFSQSMLHIDFPLMVVFTLLLWVLMVCKKDRLSRIDGAILLFSYATYITLLYV